MARLATLCYSLVLVILLNVTCYSSQPVLAPAPVPTSPAAAPPSNLPPVPTPKLPPAAPPSTSPPATPPSTSPSPSSLPSPSPPAASPGPAPVGRNSETPPPVPTTSSSGGLKAGQKAGIAVGVIVGAGLLGLAGLVYKKRQDNLRRSRYGYAARRERL